jgi:hypothetical protein
MGIFASAKALGNADKQDVGGNFAVLENSL